MQHNLLFSVVICTYNRAHLVQEYLPTVLAQALEATLYEVIVVDNNSSDRIRDVVARFQLEHPNLHYHLEPKQGLSHARNRGWQAARGQYVAYLDDECKVPNDWLTRAKQIIDVYAPLSLGGDMATFFATPRPHWWKESYALPFYNTQGKRAGWLEPNLSLFGGNMFFRRDALEAVSGFNPEFGMTGNKIYYGEEDELIGRLALRFPDQTPYYDSDLCVFHLVRPDKLSLFWPCRDIVGKAATFHSLFKPDQPYLSRFDGARFVLYAGKETLWQIALAFFGRDKQSYPFWQNHFYENRMLHEIWRTWGHLQAHYRLGCWRELSVTQH